MKLNVKTLCSIGALLLCSESVWAAKITWNYTGHKNEASVMVKGPICKNDQLKSDPFVVVRSVTFDDNNLEKFTPEIEDWLKKQDGLLSLSIQNNEFEELPKEIMKWFPRLEKIYFWNNPIKKSPDFLLYMGSLEVVAGKSDFANNSRGGLNKSRQRKINRYKEELQNVENLISKKEEELSDLQKQLESLNKIELNLKKANASKRQRKFVKRDIKKREKALKTFTNLLEKKESFENVIGELEKAQKKSLEIAERESRR